MWCVFGWEVFGGSGMVGGYGFEECGTFQDDFGLQDDHVLFGFQLGVLLIVSIIHHRFLLFYLNSILDQDLDFLMKEGF